MKPVVWVAALAAVVVVAVPARAEEPDRTKKPAPAPDGEWKPPTPVQFKTHGMDAFLVERHELPIVEMNFMFNLGGVNDPAGKEGMTPLCTDLIGEGTKDLDKNALEDKKADLAATINVGSGKEAASVHLRVARERFGPALDLLGKLLATPGLRKDDLDRLRNERKAAVLQEKGSADAVAGRVLGPVLYGKKHPYGHVTTEKSLDAVTLDDCVKVAAQVKPEGAQLVVVGDISQGELIMLLDAHLDAWKGKAPAKPRIGAPQPDVKGTVFFVDVPGAAQSRIFVAHHGPSRGEKDYYATTLMSQVLGQGISSRIVQNLREKNGFTYGARGAFGYARSGSLFSIASSVRTDATGKALREVMSEMKAMTSKPPTDDEVNRERSGTIRALPARFSTGSSSLGSLWELLFFGLPQDTFAKMPGDVKAVTTDAVKKAVKDRLRTENVVVVVAGDKAKVLEELQAIAKEGVFGKDGLVVLDGDAVKLP